MSFRILPPQGESLDAFGNPTFSTPLIAPPQNITGESAPPDVPDFEIHEESVGVTGNLIYDEDGVGSTGQVEVTGN